MRPTSHRHAILELLAKSVVWTPVAILLTFALILSIGSIFFLPLYGAILLRIGDYGAAGISFIGGFAGYLIARYLIKILWSESSNSSVKVAETMKSLFALIGVFGLLILFLAFQPREHSRVTSPDGEAVAVATYPAYAEWIPMGPGSSGDKAGTITIFKKDGTKIGQARVEMISSINDIQWTPDRAEIRLVASWEL